MNEPRKAGRPKKHLQDDHHFKPASDIDDLLGEVDELAVVETPIINAEVPENIVEAVSDPFHSHESVTIVAGISTESPIEKKIQELMETHTEQVQVDISQSLYSDDLNGWNVLDIDNTPHHFPRNGMPVRLSETHTGDGILAFWKRTRAFANATKKWSEHGAWYSFSTGVRLDFEPKFWRERF